VSVDLPEDHARDARPSSIIWIAVGAVALLWRRPRGARTLVALAATAGFVIVFNALGLFADPRFALPVAPAFVVFGAALCWERDQLSIACGHQL
jgi:hypothetical protein